MTRLQKSYFKFTVLIAVILAILFLMVSCQRLATDFADGFADSVYGGPCESNICSHGETISAEETWFFKVYFPFLKGHVTEFYAAENYGFQSHESTYRFQISPEKLSELIKVQDFKLLSLENCKPWENATDWRVWWQPKGIINKHCYSAARWRMRNDRQHFIGRDDLMYDVDNKIAYLRMARE